MTKAIFQMEIVMRRRLVILAALGIFLTIILEGALFPSIGHVLGSVNVSKGVANLLGGADWATLKGWFKVEVFAITAPFVVAGIAITAAATTIAGEEEDRILALVLASPVPRKTLVLAKAYAVICLTVFLTFITWLSLLLGTAIAGGGLSALKLAAQSLHLGFLGLALGMLALAVSAFSGQKSIAAGVASVIAILMYLINGFAPVLSAISWMKYFSFFYYYTASDPLSTGVNWGYIFVLAGCAVFFIVVACWGFQRRDLRG